MARAQGTAYEGVKLYRQGAPNAKPVKIQCSLNLDANIQALIFISKGQDLRSLSFRSITSMSFTRKHNLLTIQYKDATGSGQFVQCELDNGNSRDHLLATIESKTGVALTRS